MDTPIPKTIKIGNAAVGLIGFDSEFSRVLQMENISETDAVAILFETVKKNNYLPAGSEALYREALRQEFRRYRSPGDEDTGRLTIRVLSSGCISCRKLYTLVIDILQNLEIAADLESVEDPDEIWRYGMVKAPALVINRAIKSQGKLPSRSEIEQWIREAKSDS